MNPLRFKQSALLLENASQPTPAPLLIDSDMHCSIRGRGHDEMMTFRIKTVPGGSSTTRLVPGNRIERAEFVDIIAPTARFEIQCSHTSGALRSCRRRTRNFPAEIDVRCARVKKFSTSLERISRRKMRWPFSSISNMP